MASPDKKAEFNLESPDRTRPAWSERIQMNGSPERARLAWSSSSKSQTSNGGSPETTQSSWSKAAQSKIENPEKTRSNWSRAIQSPDADIEQDHAVRTHHHSQSRDCQTHQYYIDTTIIICSNPNVIIFLHIFLKYSMVIAKSFENLSNTFCSTWFQNQFLSIVFSSSSSTTDFRLC